MTTTRSSPSGKREQLINTALRLFSLHGYRATGIDTILEEAGVAKMTLYHHFKSKDELIVAALRQRDEEWRKWFGAAVESRSGAPRERLLAMFTVLKEWFEDREFHGCSFGQAAGEFRDPSHVVHQVAAEHKESFLAYVEALTRAAGAKEPNALAEQLCLLIEGAVMNMEVFARPGIALLARDAAMALLDRHLGPVVAPTLRKPKP